MKLVDHINVNILVVILYYNFVRCYHWVKQNKGYTASLCFISYKLHVNIQLSQ